jgi:hypothetical protein
VKLGCFFSHLIYINQDPINDSQNTHLLFFVCGLWECVGGESACALAVRIRGRGGGGESAW